MSDFKITMRKGIQYHRETVEGKELQERLHALMVKDTWTLENIERIEQDHFDDEDQDEPEDTPSLENCDDWGTGEGRWHGRI